MRLMLIAVPLRATWAASMVVAALAGAPVYAQAEKVDQRCVDGSKPYPHSSSSSGESRRLNQFVWIVDCWDKVNGSKVHNLADLYTKWTVTLNEDASSPGFYRNYDDEERSALVRLFSGRTRSTIVALKLSTINPSLDFTVPLVTINYEGRVGNGQSFVAALTQASADQPYFRLTAATAATANLNAKTTKDSESRYAVTVLGFVQDALKVAAPTSTLLTAVNREENSRFANALDSTLGQLTSHSLSEATSVGKLTEHWRENSKLRVLVHLPRRIVPTADTWPAKKTLRENGRKPDEILANWMTFDLALTCPRFSMFSDQDICHDGRLEKLDYGREEVVAGLRGKLSPQQVLSFELAPNRTLRQHITGQDWYQSFLRAIPSNSVTLDPPTKVQQASFCTSVVNELYAVGLSALDARIGLWAIVAGTGDFGNVRDLFKEVRSCTEALPGTSWSYETVAGAI